MSDRFLSAAYSRRPAPKIYDPLFLNTELSRIAASMTSYVIRNVTAATTMQKNDGMLVCNATAGAITVTLPSPAVGSGQPVTIKKSDASANAVTIGGTVDGTANRTLTAQNDSIVIQSDGTTWFRPMLTTSGTGGTTYSLTAGTHLSGGPFNGSAAVTLTTDATALNTASTIVARNASGNFAMAGLSATSVNSSVVASASANLLEYTQEFDAAVWTRTTVTVTGNTTTAPDGTTTADTLTGSGTDSNVYQVFTSPSTTRYTLSVHLKWNNTATSEFGLYDNTTAAWIVRAQVTWNGSGDVTAIATAQGSGESYAFTSAGNGFWRVSGVTTATAPIDNSLSFIVYVLAATAASSGKIVYAWGAQAETGTTLTAYTANAGIGTALSVTGKSYLTGNLILTGTLSASGLATVGGVTISTDTSSRVRIGRYSSGIPWSYISLNTGSSGLRVTNVAETVNIFELTDAGILSATARFASTTALTTPSAFAATQFTAFASTVSGATLMGYGTTGDVTLKNRAGTDALIVTANTLNVALKGTATVTGAFGCNGAAAQTAYASGGALAAYATGAFGLDSGANMSALHAMVVSIRAALVAQGTMS